MFDEKTRAKLLDLQGVIAAHLRAIRSQLTAPVKITLVVRNPEDDERSLYLSDEDAIEAPIATMRHLNKSAAYFPPQTPQAEHEARAEAATGPVPELADRLMMDIAVDTDIALNRDAARDPDRKRWGFATLAFELNQAGPIPILYVSNAEREYMRALVRAWLETEDAKAEAERQGEAETALRNAVPAGRA